MYGRLLQSMRMIGDKELEKKNRALGMYITILAHCLWPHYRG